MVCVALCLYVVCDVVVVCVVSIILEAVLLAPDDALHVLHLLGRLQLLLLFLLAVAGVKLRAHPPPPPPARKVFHALGVGMPGIGAWVWRCTCA